MQKGDRIHRGQRRVWRATIVVFALICGGTVLIAFLNRDPAMGLIMMAVNFAIMGVIWLINRLVRGITTTLYGPPSEPDWLGRRR